MPGRVAAARRIAQAPKGSLTVSMVPYDMGVYSDVVYKSIARLRDLVPGLVPQMYSSRDCTVVEAVAQGKADVGVVFDVPRDLDEGYVCKWIMDYPVMVWANRANPALASGSPRLADFASCKLIKPNNKMVPILLASGAAPHTFAKPLTNSWESSAQM